MFFDESLAIDLMCGPVAEDASEETIECVVRTAAYFEYIMLAVSTAMLVVIVFLSYKFLDYLIKRQVFNKSKQCAAARQDK